MKKRLPAYLTAFMSVAHLIAPAVGEEWQTISAGPAGYFMCMVETYDNHLVAGGTRKSAGDFPGVRLSFDRGRSWVDSKPIAASGVVKALIQTSWGNLFAGIDTGGQDRPASFQADPSPVTFVEQAESYHVDSLHRPACSCSVLLEDYDRAGYTDVFIGNHARQGDDYRRDELWWNSDGGNPPTLLDRSGDAFQNNLGPVEPRAAEGAVFGDLNNDGLMELVILSGTGDPEDPLPTDIPDLAYRASAGTQDNPVLFTEDAGGFGLSSASTIPCGIALLDIDNDGWLDVYRQGHHGQFVFLNDGTGFLTDATSTLGLDGHFDGDAMGIASADFDGDGDLDIFVGIGPEEGEPGKNVLLQNTGTAGQWPDRAPALGLDDSRSAFSAAWGDIDNDGDPDLYVANNALFDPDPTDALYRNDYSTAGIFNPLTGSSYPASTDKTNTVIIADMDNDGWQDVVTAGPDSKHYLKGMGQGALTDVTAQSGLMPLHPTYSMAAGDINGDGFLDILCGNTSGNPNELYINRGNGNNWLRVRLEGKGAGGSNCSAIGSRVDLRAADRTQTRWVTPSGPGNYLELTVHFGLGSLTRADVLTVSWPSGKTTSLVSGLDANQTIRTYESNYINLNVGPTDIGPGDATTLFWSCDFRHFNYQGVPVDVYLALIKNPIISESPSSVSDLLGGEAVYLFGSRMKGIYLFSGTVREPTFGNVDFSSVPPTGSLTLKAPRAGGLAGDYAFATTLIRRDNGNFVRNDNWPVENSNLITLR